MKNVSEMFKYYLTKYLYCEIYSILIFLVDALQNIFDIIICQFNYNILYLMISSVIKICFPIFLNEMKGIIKVKRAKFKRC